MEKKIKVLMVDDEERFTKTMKKNLDRRDFITTTAVNGTEALKKIEENPDVVVLDINMPGMDGHQTLKEIKKKKPDIPIIMLTGFGNEASARRSLEDEAYDYLNKPCEVHILAEKIRKAYLHRKDGLHHDEKKVRDIMIPIEEYTTLHPEATIKDAISKIKESFTSKSKSRKVMETGHRSLIVIDDSGSAQGILTIFDLLESIMPSYLNSPKPSTADSIVYSPLFWKGMFTREMKGLADKSIKEIMSPVPVTITGDATLMEAAYRLASGNVRRIVVTEGEKITGVVREQDLFFEMERILTEK